MNIGIYHEPGGSGLGGAELVAAEMAAALLDGNKVTLLHHFPTLTREELARFAEVDLDGIEVKFVERPTKGWQAWDSPVWRLRLDLERWQAQLSARQDLFVVSTHAVPPFCQAGKGAIYVHFPNFDRRAAWPWNARGESLAGRARAATRRWYHEHLWQQRLAGYSTKLANSRFTADWTKTYWGVDCDVVYPPVRTQYPNLTKSDTIVVLGRFTPMKRQLEMVQAFRERVQLRLPGWSMICVGTVGRGAEDQDYFRSLEAAAGGAVRLLTNLPIAVLRRELTEGRIFWHGAGFLVDPIKEPHRLEHFGIATVEAMAAGCVPLVPNRGGQSEIVRHGQDGFLCDDINEMAERTLEIIADNVKLIEMSASARERAGQFRRERFAEQVRSRLLISG